MTLRRRLCWYSLVADALLALGSYQLAVVVFTSFHHCELRFFTERFEWGLPLAVVAILVTFVWLGLYKLEAYVSRPLHLFTLLKGSLIALVITAFFAFTFKSPVVSESRLTVFTAFAVFFVASAVVRIALLDRLYVADVRARRGGSMVIGASADSSVIASRCRDLRGYAPVLAIEPLDRRRNGYDAEPALLARPGRRRAGAAPGVPGRRLRGPQGDLRPHRRGSLPGRRGVRHRPAGEPARHHAAADAPLRDARDARASRPGRR